MRPPGQTYFWPHGYDLNKLGRGPLDDARYMYQISRLLIGSVVSDIFFLSFHLENLSQPA